MENNDFSWIGFMLLFFFYPKSWNFQVPKEIEEIYNKYKNEDGNIKDIESFIKEMKSYVDKFYNDIKETFIKSENSIE